MKSKTFTFSLTDEMAAKLEELATKKGLSKAGLIKLALSEYFEKQGEKSDSEKK